MSILTFSSQSSLTRTTLLQMSLRITLVITAVTLLSYWHITSILESQTKEQLDKYITQRGLRDSNLFVLAEDNQALLKKELLFRLEQLDPQDSLAEFDRLLVKGNDGVIRNRPEMLDGTRQPGVYIGNNVSLTDEIRQRVLTFYDLTKTYGAAWNNRFLNTYILLPENAATLYWPSIPTMTYDIPADYNIIEQEFFWVSDVLHNPKRITVWTGTYYDSNAKAWMVSCETPVDLNGKHIATIGHDIILTDLFQRTIDEHLQGAYNFIFREDGRLIAHPHHKEEILKNQGNFNISQSADPHLTHLFQLIKNKKPDTAVLDNLADNEFLAVTNLEGPHWYFVTVYPKTLLTNLAFQTARFILMLGILSLVIEIIVLFIVLRKQVAQPLTKFMTATEQLATGNFEVRLDTTRPDELGRLAQSFQKMAQDIEAREVCLKGALEEVGATNQQLTQEIEERKQIEQQLQQAKNLAEASNRAKNIFLANMTHELRTPLNAVLGYAQILKSDKGLTSEQQEGIHIIQRGGEYLLTLIEDLLDLSKIESEDIQLCPTVVNFPRFLKNITELFQLRAEQKGIAFLYEPLSPLPTGISVDEKRLRQILVNLLGNAIKFTHQGGVVLKVGYQAGKLRLQVEDTGIGIAEADWEKIFLPFQQGGDSKYRPDGAGVGLTLTKTLVELMGGELQVESQLGRGSVFWTDLTLPDASPEILSQPVVPTITGYEGPSRTFLIADDRWENRSVLVNLLKPLGFQTIEAKDGQECLNLAMQLLPDAIITDLVMPYIDGFEVARRLRTAPQFQDVVIIAASASVFNLNPQESLAAGCNAFITKPVRAQILLELLQQHLGLTWIYEQPLPHLDSHPATEPQNQADNVELLKEPSAEQATILYEFCLLGDIDGLLAEVEKIEQADPQLVPFANQIRRLAKNFELDKIDRLVGRYI